MSLSPTILVIATLDTKAEETFYLKRRIEKNGCRALVMDTGILNNRDYGADIGRDEVAEAGGTKLSELLASGQKGECISAMMRGCAAMAERLHRDGRVDGVLAIGGAQGTDIGTAAMRALPFGVPKFMVSTVASGRATFGPYVGTKDIVMMHSVADIQGINFLTRGVFDNAAAAVCAMAGTRTRADAEDRPAVAMSMLGTTTPGAMRAHAALIANGYDPVSFHQNGTGGIAMEDLIREGRFRAVLDINLHELGDAVAGGLHAAIRDCRLAAATEKGIPQVIAPGSVNYAVWGPEKTLAPKLLKRRYIVHNPQLTLVRLSKAELKKTAEVVAARLSAAKGPTHVFIPLRGFSYPDREGGPHWDPEANAVFIQTLRKKLNTAIPYDELDMHINDPEFVDIAVEALLNMLR